MNVPHYYVSLIPHYRKGILLLIWGLLVVTMSLSPDLASFLVMFYISDRIQRY